MTPFRQSISALKGIGEKKAVLFHRLDIFTIGDLLTHFPRAYEDRTVCRSIGEAPGDAPCCVSAVVITPARHTKLKHGLELSKLTVADDSGRLTITFFNQRYAADSLLLGREYVFYGTIEGVGSRKHITNPLFEASEAPPFFTRRIVPVYPLTAGLTNRAFSRFVAQALALTDGRIPEPVPDALRSRYHLAHKSFALQAIHFPASAEALELARRRLIWEEFFLFALALARSKQRHTDTAGFPIAPVSLEPFLQALPFSLTSAQRRVIHEIAEDCASGPPMRRLVQGDVGSGKTMVAAAAVYLAAKNEMQTAFMAPTELLARQHFHTISPLLEACGISVGLLTGSMRPKEKHAVLQALESGEISLLIGTHALLSERVAFSRLGLVITDEQHRFGVQQRASLAEKGQSPHVLVLSATPIPRTLALILYSDLDLSIVDELPPGRQPVKTFFVGENKRAKLYEFVRKTVSEGRQAYFVCPTITEKEESASERKAVKQYTELLQRDIFPDLRIGCIHGQMAAGEKEQVMQSFSEGGLDLLIATTVIEVGVDVPNAALMIVEDAERFGLSQLHQLRGRVGRGAHQSYCFLLSSHPSEETRARLRALCKSNDGFQIAEADLKLRGPGDFFGVRQHGMPKLKIGSLPLDLPLLQEAQSAAAELLARDPHLTEPEHLCLQKTVSALLSQMEGGFS